MTDDLEKAADALLSLAKGSVKVKSYKRLVKGKMQDVEQYTSVRSLADAVLDSAPERPPISAKGGAYPKGRSVPGYFPKPVKAAEAGSAHAAKVKKELDTQREKDSKTSARAAKKAVPVAEAAGYKVTAPDTPEVSQAKADLEAGGYEVKRPTASEQRAASDQRAADEKVAAKPPTPAKPKKAPLSLDDELPREEFDEGGGKVNIAAIAKFLKPRIKRGKGSKKGKGTASDPIDVGDNIELAHQLLSEGKHIRMESVEGVTILVDKVRGIVREAKASGKIDTLPEYDLCKVTVPKTNLFCMKSKGIPRIKMPQFGGEPTPGTPADARRVHPDDWTNPKGEKERVDIEPDFRKLLEEMGVTVTPKTVRTATLKATQDQLDLSKVSDLSQAMLDGKIKEAPIFVTRDGYIIDGHHRWASKMVNSLAGDENSDEMPVEELDMEIGEAIALSTAFAEMMGIAPQDVERRSLSPQAKHRDARERAAEKTRGKEEEAADVLAEAERLQKALPKPVPNHPELRAEYGVRAKKVAPAVLKRAKTAERDITAALVAVVAENNGEMTGLEFRLKTRESLERKLVDKAVDKGITPEEYGDRVADALRYTALFHPDEYVAGAEATLARLKEQGFIVVSVENSWERGDGYSGTNVELIHPNGLRWELQFHTHDSVEMKEVAHKYYELVRQAEIAMEIRKDLYERMVDLWNYVDQPAGWEDFGSLVFRDDAPREVALAAMALRRVIGAWYG